MKRLALFLLALLATGCLELAPRSDATENTCLRDADCAAPATCDEARLLCVRPEASPFEIAIEVLPPSDATGAAAPAWTSSVLRVDSPTTQDMVQPAPLRAVGTVTWNGQRVPADILFRRATPSGTVVRRTTTLPQPMLVAEMEADYEIQLESGATYDIEVRPAAQTMDGTDTPWLRALPPLYFSAVEAPEIDASSVWPLPLEYPAMEIECGSTVQHGCALSGRVVDEDNVGRAGLQVRAIDTAGRLLSSTALTDEEGAFRILTSPGSDAPYVLSVGASDGLRLFPTLRIRPDRLDPDEALIRVPEPRVVAYRGSVESNDGSPLSSATLAFRAQNLFDEETGLTGSFQVTVETNEFGEFDTELLAGQYELVISPASDRLAVSSETIAIMPPVGSDMIQGQLFVLAERARLEGRVRTERREGVEGVAVEAIAVGELLGLDSSARHNRSSVATTDEDGKFDLRLDVGAYDFFIKPPSDINYPWIVLSSQVVSSLELGLENPFELQAPVPVDGTVTTSSGAPLPNAQIRVFGRGTSEERFIEIGRTETDESGYYELLVAPR